MKYYINAHFDAVVEVEVEAKSESEALGKVNDVAWLHTNEAEFLELRDTCVLRN